MTNPESLEEKIKTEELLRIIAERKRLEAATDLENEQLKHLKRQKWWERSIGTTLVGAVATILVAIVSTQVTIRASKNELSDLMKQIEAQRERQDESIVRNFWVAHVLRSLKGSVPNEPNGNAYRGYIDTNYVVLLREYDSMNRDVKRRIEENYSGVVTGPK